MYKDVSATAQESSVDPPNADMCKDVSATAQTVSLRPGKGRDWYYQPCLYKRLAMSLQWIIQASHGQKVPLGMLLMLTVCRVCRQKGCTVKRTFPSIQYTLYGLPTAVRFARGFQKLLQEMIILLIILFQTLFGCWRE